MNCDVSVNGKPWKVALEPAGVAGRYTVTLKGKRREIDVAWFDADTLSVIDMQSGVAREIVLTRHANGTLDVFLGGKAFRVVASEKAEKIEKPASRASVLPAVAARTGLDAFPSEDARVTSPMPGRVVRVLVAVGDTVTAGQGVVVVEAMKMENELRAKKAGLVTDVLVKEGEAIDSGAALVIIR
jgi:biotin carboxyl carrier protein